jgi:hypothetical protein
MPELDALEYSYGGVCNRNPNGDSLNWQPGPGSNAEADHLLRLIIPPLIGHSQCSFPQETYQKDEEECEAEGMPVNESPDGWKEAGRRNKGGKYEENEILGETFSDRR